MQSDPPPGPPWTPRIDIFISIGGELNIEVEVGPMRRENLELALEGNRLLIKGQRLLSESHPQCEYLVKEVPSGMFERVVEVPFGFNVAAASAAYHSGLLKIVVPRFGTLLR